MSDPQQEYVEALAAYREAVARLQEAKRHIPLSPQARWKQRRREQREADRAHYLANKAALDAQHNEWVNRITAKALQVLHQKLNTPPSAPWKSPPARACAFASRSHTPFQQATRR